MLIQFWHDYDVSSVFTGDRRKGRTASIENPPNPERRQALLAELLLAAAL